jgi:hypothetical protein
MILMDFTIASPIFILTLLRYMYSAKVLACMEDIRYSRLVGKRRILLSIVLRNRAETCASKNRF